MSILTKKNIAIFIALLFHVSEFIGIVFSPYKDWFISYTSLNLIIMAGLLIYTQPIYNKNFFLFILIAIFTGFFVEAIGVNTGILFGNYSYGTVLGTKLYGVPILVGVQWFVIVFCCGVIMQYVNNWAYQKIVELGANSEKSDKIQSISIIIDAALLASFFDFIMEPVAQKLGYWQWENNIIPFFNYTTWFFVSGLLLYIFNKLSFNKLNPFALHLFIIQLLFFIALRIYL